MLLYLGSSKYKKKDVTMAIVSIKKTNHVYTPYKQELTHEMYLYHMILVTGSTGLVGKHLLLSLTQKDQSVRALYRSESKKAEVVSFFAFAKAESQLHRIDWVQGDITEIPSLTAAFKDATYVYHCAALISFDPYQFKELTKTNIEGTANVVNLSLANNIKKLVHISSIATLASTPNNPITEDNFWDPDAQNSVYALTKNGAEMEVWRGTQEGLNTIILNPGIVIGEGNYQTGSGKFFNHILEGKALYPTGGSAVIDVKDLVALMEKAMNSTLAQERYIATAYNVTYRDLLEEIAKTLGKKAPSSPLSNGLLQFLNFLDSIRGIFTRKRQITKIGYKSLQRQTLYSNNKIIEAFDYIPTPLDVTLSRIALHINQAR
ncbi:NAD-dependent epimerase/dehydratase family protein [uncultured Dokdonia sp.]|uniref:NAD-dependent epimerase/dehydratase family protein n=1 Tax=uncultured Dokdonia sp. TaxID=575653 RepID=UPI00261F9B0C|nr:NAD-dependent epimerase/dehydratase family protein [uncultured Dokdonia sp.]